MIGVAAWVGVRGWLASRELQAAAPQASVAQKAIAAGDVATASAAAHGLAKHAASAASLTGDPVWRATEVLPWVGGNLRAVRVLSSSLDEAAGSAIVPLVDLGSSLGVSSFRPQNGAIDLKPLIAARPTADRAQVAMTRASHAVNAIDPTGLAGPIADARTKLASALGTASGITDGLDTTLKVLPTMLGSDGPRNYLVLFQNNAELRAAGGIPGEVALLHAENGAISLGTQASTGDFPHHLDAPVMALPDETGALYGDRPAEYVQDVTMTPDFPLTAQLATAMWTQRFGGTIDGVVAVDPVALSYLLTATGPVAVPGAQPLTAENAVQTLLVTSYTWGDDQAAQDAYFNSAARSAFTAILGGGAKPDALLKGLLRSSQENRISLWSANAAEQKILGKTTLSGLSAVQKAAGPQAYGVYLNDSTGGKMGAYLTTAVDVGAKTTRDDGRSDVSIRVTMTNTAPADAATALPFLVTAGGHYGVPAGDIATNVVVYGPAGAFEGGVEKDGKLVSYQSGTDGGHRVQTLQVSLQPGQSASYTFRFVSAKPKQDAPVVVHTPVMNSIEVGRL